MPPARTPRLSSLCASITWTRRSSVLDPAQEIMGLDLFAAGRAELISASGVVSGKCSGRDRQGDGNPLLLTKGAEEKNRRDESTQLSAAGTSASRRHQSSWRMTSRQAQARELAGAIAG